MRKKLAAYFYQKPRIQRSRGKADMMQYAYVSFLLCFVLGIFGANLFLRGTGVGAGWSAYWMESLKYREISSADFFAYLLGERTPIFLLFLLLAFTNLSIALGIGYIGWQGFCVGTLMSLAVMSYGIKGMLLILVGMLPHYILYFALLFLYLWLMREKRNGQRLPQAAAKRRVLFCLMGLLLFLVFLAGIFLESYVNPYFLKKYLKFI
ncbi:MAG: hypothetical protein HFI42_01870 [Lachnospiraceae bacterium]|nr:hypothetical protein [Lachnospiraceae bacterium]MCI9149232.1 hypothetical protein [Lachnospiraceae bacterium]